MVRDTNQKLQSLPRAMPFLTERQKRASAQTPLTALFITTPKINPTYTWEEQNILINLGAMPGSQGCETWKTCSPQHTSKGCSKGHSQNLHIGAKSLLCFLQPLFFHPSLLLSWKRLPKSAPPVLRFPPRVAWDHPLLSLLTSSGAPYQGKTGILILPTCQLIKI
jgi:hypothetical protein